MDWKSVTDWITAASTVVIAGTGVWALLYAHRQLKQARETEKVNHLIGFVREFESEPMAGYRRKAADKRLRGTTYPPEAQNILNFFETIGLLVRRGYLDVDDVWSSFSYWMFNVYADFRDDIEQEQREDETYYWDFCELLRQLQIIEVDNGGDDGHPSKDEIRDFWGEELKTIAGAPLRRRKPKKSVPQRAEKNGDAPGVLKG